MDEFLPNVIKVEGIKAEADFTIEEDVPPPMFPDDPLALTQQEASQMTVKREASVDSTFPLSEMGSRKKRRKTNFTNLEMIVLMREVEKRKAILQGIPSMAITADTKRNAWFHVTAQVNKVGGERRLVADVRKKYRDFRSFVKKKAARIKNYQSQTGDGSPPPERLTPVEKIMAATLEDTVVSNNTNNQEAEDVSPAPDGGPREELVLRPSEEMMLNSGLLEWEAIEGLTDVDDIIDPDPSVTGSSCPVGDDAVASASAAVLTLDGQGTSVTSGTLGAAECISETRESFTGKVSTAKVLHPSTDITTRATANDHPYAMRGKQETSSCPLSSPESHPSRHPVCCHSCRLLEETMDRMVDIQGLIRDQVYDAADSLHQIATSLKNIKHYFLKKKM